MDRSKTSPPPHLPAQDGNSQSTATPLEDRAIFIHTQVVNFEPEGEGGDRLRFKKVHDGKRDESESEIKRWLLRDPYNL